MFSLVAYLVIAGQLHAFVLDDGLSARDCKIAAAYGAITTTTNSGAPVDLTRAWFVCEEEA